jgi:hypothetical protein
VQALCEIACLPNREIALAAGHRGHRPASPRNRPWAGSRQAASPSQQPVRRRNHPAGHALGGRRTSSKLRIGSNRSRIMT